MTPFEQAGLMAWETGFCGQRNFEAGGTAMAKVNLKRQLYFALEI